MCVSFSCWARSLDAQTNDQRSHDALMFFLIFLLHNPRSLNITPTKDDIKWWWEVGRLLLFGRYGSFSGFHLSLFFIPKLLGETFAETLEETLEADAHSAVPWTDLLRALTYLLMDIRKPQTKKHPFWMVFKKKKLVKNGIWKYHINRWVYHGPWDAGPKFDVHFFWRWDGGRRKYTQIL